MARVRAYEQIHVRASQGCMITLNPAAHDVTKNPQRRCAHGSAYCPPVLYPDTYCICMSPAGAGSNRGRYVGLRCRLATSHTTPVSAATPATAAAMKMGILYFWKKPCDVLLASSLPLPETCCEPVVSFPPSRVATKSACAEAGSVVERS